RRDLKRGQFHRWDRLWRALCYGWDGDWVIDEGVRRRVRPRHNVADQAERQVGGAEDHEGHLWVLLPVRLGACLEAKVPVCRRLNTLHILSNSAERALPIPALLGAWLDQI